MVDLLSEEDFASVGNLLRTFAMNLNSETLDMSCFFGSAEEKELFCQTLLGQLKTRGCVKIRNHGIADETIHTLFDMVGATG